MLYQALGGFFIFLAAAMLVRRYVWRGKDAASDSEKATWPMWGLLIFGVLMVGGGGFVDELLEKLKVFVQDVIEHVRGPREP